MGTGKFRVASRQTVSILIVIALISPSLIWAQQQLLQQPGLSPFDSQTQPADTEAQQQQPQLAPQQLLALQFLALMRQRQQQNGVPNLYGPQSGFGFSQPVGTFGNYNPSLALGVGGDQYNPLLNALLGSPPSGLGRGFPAFNARNPFTGQRVQSPTTVSGFVGDQIFPSAARSGAANDDSFLPRPQEGPQTFFGIYGIPSTLVNWEHSSSLRQSPSQNPFALLPQVEIPQSAMSQFGSNNVTPVQGQEQQSRVTVTRTVYASQPSQQQPATSDAEERPNDSTPMVSTSSVTVEVTKTITETTTVSAAAQNSGNSAVTTAPDAGEAPSHGAVDIQPTPAEQTTQSSAEAESSAPVAAETETTTNESTPTAEVSTETPTTETSSVTNTQQQSTEASSTGSVETTATDASQKIPLGFQTGSLHDANPVEKQESTTQEPSAFSTQQAASDTIQPPQVPPCIPLECVDNPADGNCYAFMKDTHTVLFAERECLAHCATLARATETNRDFLAKLVDDQFSDNKTACYERITMLANQQDVRPKKYGTFAYIMGGQCRNNDSTDENDAAYEVCSPLFDCTLVDWLHRAHWICSKPSKNQTQEHTNNASALIDQPPVAPNSSWCITPLNDQLQLAGGSSSAESGQEQQQQSPYDVYVTCTPIIEPIVSEFKYYEPLCVPFDVGSSGKQYAQQVMRAFKLDSVRLLTAFILPQIGAFRPCFTKAGTDCNETEESQAPVYGLCRLQQNLPLPSNETAHYAQLWTDGRVPYSLADFADFPDNMTAIRNAMNDIVTQSMACIKFEEINSTASPAAESSDHLDIVRHQSPNTCSINAVGRAGGPQPIAYGKGCFNKVGLLYRLLLHALGIPAEHLRYDRDQYLNVQTEFANPDPAFQKLARSKQTIPGILSLNTTYDYDSVTHFPPEALAAQKNTNVFVPKNPNVKIGQRTHLSEGDKQKLQLLYESSSDEMLRCFANYDAHEILSAR